MLTYLFSVPTLLLTGNDVVSYIGLLGNDGFIVDYSQLTIGGDPPAESLSAVPEPASLALLGSGLVALAARIRRRRRSA